MPDNSYFRQPDTQRMLLDVLFTWAKLNPDVGYRQGMHEVAAPILWVVERDGIKTSTIPPETSADTDQKLVRLMFDSAFIEHDTFTLFNLVMQNARSSYEHQEVAKQHRPSSSVSSPKHQESPMVERCRRIIEVYVARCDPSLATHLAGISIIPQIFLL